MSYKRSRIFVVVMGVLLASVSMGAAAEVELQAKAIKAGALEITPTLGLSLGRNSNVGRTNVKTASSFTMLNPSIAIGLPTHGQLYGANYSGNFSRFAGSSIDNFNDHNFGLFADNVWNSRFNSLVNFDYIKGHDGRNAVSFKNQELWHTSGIKGLVHYGAEGATGQFEFAAGQMSKRYDTNRGGSTNLYNFDRTDLSGTFFYKVAPATQLFVELDNSKFTYVDAASKIRDSTQQQYMVGAKWDATAKTTGSFKIGSMKKSFNLGTPSGKATVWDADITWSPKTYSKVDFSVHQNANEYGGSGNYTLSKNTDVKWTHDWTGYVSSALSMGDGVDTFEASVPNRVDKRQSYAMKVMYGIKPWLKASLGYEHTKRNSTNTFFSYTQGVTMLTLEGSL